MFVTARNVSQTHLPHDTCVDKSTIHVYSRGHPRGPHENIIALRGLISNSALIKAKSKSQKLLKSIAEPCSRMSISGIYLTAGFWLA